MLENGTYIEFSTGIYNGSGDIVGIATTENPVIGIGYIVNLDNRPIGYEYDCVVVFENMITFIEEKEE